MTPLRILIVDDYPDDALLATAVLTRDGLEFDHTVAATVSEAVAQVTASRFDVVVSDYNLGAGSGLEVLAKLRGSGSEVPFILLSGTIGEERAAEAIRLGANDYVMKDGMARLPAVVRRELSAVEARVARQQLEERVRRAEERYRRTFEQAPLAIANASIDGRFVSANQRLCELLGYSESELIGRHFTHVIHPYEREEARACVASLLAGRESLIRRPLRRYLRRDDSEVWVSVTLSAVRDLDGAIDYLVLCAEDVSQQREAQEKVLLQARLLECVEQAVIAVDTNGNVIFWNAYAERLYGWPAAEAIGRPLMDLTPAAEARGQAEAILATLKGGASFSGEIVLRRRDGTTFPAYVTDAPILDEGGRMIGIVSVSHDLTDRKRAEDDLRENRLQLADAQEIARIGSWTYDFRTRERRWSDSLLRMYGLPPGTPLSVEDVFASIHPDDRERVRADQRRVMETFEPCTTVFRVVAKSGLRTFALRARVDCDDAGTPLKVMGVVQDVTEIKEIEEELRQRTAQQTTVANLGQIALSGASVQSVLDQAAFFLRALLDVDLAGVLRKHGDELELVAGDGWDETELGLRMPAGVGSQATFTIVENAPVVVEDIATETRFVASAVLQKKGMVSGLTVVIDSADGTPWGVLGVHAKSRRSFTAYDVEFLRSMASVLGQAIDRSQADAELRARARQQSAIASLGRLVLNSVDSLVLDRVTDLLVDGLDADFGFIAELTPGGALRKVAGRLWTNLPEKIPVDAHAQAGLTIISGEPVIVDDYRTETRFNTFAVTVPHGILSGLMVPVASARRTFGVLSAQSRRAGHFRAEHVDFLQSLANILAEALEREQARFAIEESEERYRRIFDGASEIIFTIDRGARFVTLSPAFAAITGWTCEEWIGRRFDELLVPEDVGRVTELFHGIVDNGHFTSTETTLIGRDRRVIVDMQSFPKVENGVVTEIYGFARDVTDARSAAAERERVTRSLELLLESTIEGIYTIDLDGTCTMVNRAAAAFLGATPQDLLGRRVHDLLHSRHSDGKPAECPMTAVLRTGEAMGVSSDLFSRVDGSMLPVAYSAAPIVDGGRLVGAVVTFSDLTERRKLEAKLEQATRLAGLGRLAATVAHEFNNVLMGISPFVQVIQRAPSPEKVASALEHISTSVKRGRRVTEDILRFTQPGEPALAAIQVDTWLHSMASEARGMIGARYSLTVDAEPVAIDADSGQLHQIFMNLILNARDAMEGGGSVDIRARRARADQKFAFGAVLDPARYVHFTVTDTGCGMSEETLRHVFEPLFTTKRKGTGLGLAVTHQVVQRHGGEIFIDSKPGEGTTFHIFIPRSARDIESVPENAGEQPQDASKRRLLLVEDDPAVAAGLATLLECEGFTVNVVSSGAQALEYIRHETPDAVILDVGLPDMDGQTVFAGIARIHPTLPIVFSTGHTERSQLEALVSRPHVGYLMKPYEARALIEELSRTMVAEG